MLDAGLEALWRAGIIMEKLRQPVIFRSTTCVQATSNLWTRSCAGGSEFFRN
jgi:3-deoxy-D-manno-octulosonic acid (KDO) 8-phosphate synthase